MTHPVGKNPFFYQIGWRKLSLGISFFILDHHKWYSLSGSTPLSVPQFTSLAKIRKGGQINKILKKSLLSYTEPVRTLTNIYDREIRIEFNNYWTRLSMMWRIMQIVESLSTEAEGRSDVERRIKVCEKWPFFISPLYIQHLFGRITFMQAMISTQKARGSIIVWSIQCVVRTSRHCAEFNLRRTIRTTNWTYFDLLTRPFIKIGQMAGSLIPRVIKIATPIFLGLLSMDFGLLWVLWTILQWLLNCCVVIELMLKHLSHSVTLCGQCVAYNTVAGIKLHFDYRI